MKNINVLKKRLTGVWSLMITPFHANFEVNWKGLRENTNERVRGAYHM